jgi:hypothetical protein
MPMNFEEMDLARRQAALTAFSDKRGKKRKNATVARLMHHQPQSLDDVDTNVSPTFGPVDEGIAAAAGSSVVAVDATAVAATSTVDGDAADLRTGRWTLEETDYCDSLIRLFEQGKLPIPDGIKLNEFLANMLKSKQARLTKKMKNAKLATRQYKRNAGYIASADEARAFSILETEFFASIKCPMERSEIRFHMQKEWRELFSSYCILIGQSLDANAWLCSVEELDQRTSLQKDAARMVRRKVMLGHALTFDSSNSDQRGVHIDTVAKLLQHKFGTSTEQASNGPQILADPKIDTKILQDTTVNAEAIQRSELQYELTKTDINPLIHYASPFIEKVMQVLFRLSIPFEHVDVWVPSFVDSDPADNDEQQLQKCRLCFAGCGTAETKITSDGAVPLNVDEKFDLISFGEYSEKFSFEIGCGLPGRVYSSGVASWEQGIQNAPLEQFERSGGAKQWGIQTVLGIPVPSQSAGRVVILLYSTDDRPRNLKLVNRLTEVITKVRVPRVEYATHFYYSVKRKADLSIFTASKLRPSPKWKLVVDVGVGPPAKPDEMTEEEAQLRHELLILIQKCMPVDKNSQFASYLPGFTSLRLLLTQHILSPREEDLLKSILGVYASYKKGSQRSEPNIAVLTARDFMLLSKPEKNSSVLNPKPTSTRATIHQPGQKNNFMDRCSPFSSQDIPPSNVNNSQNGVSQLSVTHPSQVRYHKNNVRGDSIQDAFVLNTFSLSSHGQDYTGLSLGASPALHPIVGSPALDSQEQFASLGNSPTLQPISSHHDGAVSEVTTLCISASPLSDMLRREGPSSYREL